MTQYRAVPGTPPILTILARMRVTDRGCWEWLGATIKDGYGTISTPEGVKLVHRVSYEHFIGPIPVGLIVRHKCDNPPCVFPSHLEIGTARDNAQDMLDRGRWKPYRGRFSSEQVQEIRKRYSLGEKQAALGKEYGVSQSAISAIVRGKSYAPEEVDMEAEGSVE